MNSTAEINMIAALNLDSIKEKLMHRQSGEGWSPDHATAVESEYRRFLCLMKLFPHEQVAPSLEVDIFWHYHILDTRKYANDCAQIFGFFLHHVPSIETSDQHEVLVHQRNALRMQELYAATFGEDFPQQTYQETPNATWCQPATPTAAWCQPATNLAAWCQPATPKAAWCQPATNLAAWCQPATPKAAWCQPATTLAAWCQPAAPASAWCQPATAKTAWCQPSTEKTSVSHLAKAIRVQASTAAQNNASFIAPEMAIAA